MRPAVLPTLRQLEYLVAVADRGSFRAAARACGVTQPGLSAQIQQVEEHLGVRVFERNRRKVLLTPAGVEVLRRARTVLHEAEQLVEAAQAGSGPLRGRLRLGVIPTVAPYLLPRALPRVRERFPELRLQLREAMTPDLLEALQRGELDLLLLALESRLGGVETHALFRDAFAAALPAGHRLARRKHLDLDDLAGEQVLLLDDGHCLRDQALDLCNRVGVEEVADLRASSLGTLVQMVAGGEGLTLLPSLALPVEEKAEGLAIVPLKRPAPYRTIGLAWRPTSAHADDYRTLGQVLAGDD